MSQSNKYKYSSEHVTEIFSPQNKVRAMLNFEAALAKAEATAGVIPEDAAAIISKSCEEAVFDAADLEARGSRAGTMVIPLVKDLISHVHDKSPEAARFVHFGSTSQDVLDTALVLNLKEAIFYINADLERMEKAFAKLAREHAGTLLLGRTLLQPGSPISFGLKAAGWASAVRRGRERINQSGENALVLQFGGAVGTLSTLHSNGLKVGKALSAELGLPLPDAPWHTHRDRLVGFASALAILVGTLGKIARDISLHMQREIGELSEPIEEGRGGSSAMPHKRNPVGCMHVLSAANRVPGLLSSLLSGMVQEHERSIGNWSAEWSTYPDLIKEVAKASSAILEVSEGLEVNTKQMRKNLDETLEIVFSEALAAALIPHLGRKEAQRLVANLLDEVITSNKPLSLVASANPFVSQAINSKDLKNVFDPNNALGSTNDWIERLLAGEAKD
ncbi:MAG: 3-carboxy-cis,cis-muconate cycloisomerase [Verrucomicrobia bacterium]|nr:3-carboxy-cis,cis-muconate cycloisomerase [Verrucomicrobiota bacterium]MDA1066672.1 3-carboxy-cis,cis-muconate cycloisomerase [Verrucomicrobiota bacterium]